MTPPPAQGMTICQYEGHSRANPNSETCDGCGEPVWKKPAPAPEAEKCPMCASGQHHSTEHLPGVDYADAKDGDVVFVRAVVTKVEEGDFHTEVSVKQYQPGYPPRSFWTAKVNSVDLFPADGGEVRRLQEELAAANVQAADARRDHLRAMERADDNAMAIADEHYRADSLEKQLAAAINALTVQNDVWGEKYEAAEAKLAEFHRLRDEAITEEEAENKALREALTGRPCNARWGGMSSCPEWERCRGTVYGDHTCKHDAWRMFDGGKDALHEGPHVCKCGAEEARAALAGKG